MAGCFGQVAAAILLSGALSLVIAMLGTGPAITR
jgi:hypothetical protein